MVVALLLPSIEVIIGLIGSTIGVMICVMFPASLFVKITQKKTKEKMLAQILLLVGFLIMILGTYANLNAIDEAKSGSHLEVKIIDSKNPVVFVKPPNSLEDIEDKINKLDKYEKSDIKPFKSQENNEPGKLPVEANISIDKKEQKINFKNKETSPKIPDISIKAETISKIVNKDAILKEEREIVIEQQDQEIKDKKEEIKRLEETKSKLEKNVLLGIKEEIVKQNKETQDLFLQKYKEIEVKVNKIEKKYEEKSKLPSDQSDPKIKESNLDDLVELANDVRKEPSIEVIKSPDTNLKDNKDELVKHNKETQNLALKKLDETKEKVIEMEANNDDKIFNPPSNKVLADLELPKSYEPIAKLMHVEKNQVPEAPVIVENTELREDPYIKLFKNVLDKNEPHSYKLGKNMTQQNNNTLSVEGPLKELPDLTRPKDTKYYNKNPETEEKPQDSLKKTDELKELTNSRESHNEIRKKRETDLDPENCENELLDLVPGLLIETMISRDLKSTKQVK